MRSGTGLYGRLYGRPHTAGASLFSSLPTAKLLQLKQQMSIPEEPSSLDVVADIASEQARQLEEERVLPPIPSHITQPVKIQSPEAMQIVEPVVEEEEKDTGPPPPPTDIKPKINVGNEHQATLPTLRSKLLIYSQG